MGVTSYPYHESQLKPDREGDSAATPEWESETSFLHFEDREALVLSGGGARGAYQVGVLKAVSEWLPADASCPFDVLVGTSAGALNVAALAARAGSFREAVRALESVWAHFSVDQVVDTGTGAMLQAGLHWVTSLITAGYLVPPPRSLLDNAPLRELLRTQIPLGEIPKAIDSGVIQAVAVATTSYTTGQAVTFFDGIPQMQGWDRVRRTGVRRTLDQDVLLASASIPFIFPATELDGQFFGDGAMRQLAPLSPAVHLGANRVLVIGTKGEGAAVPMSNVPASPPAPGHLLGFVLDSLFTDGLSIDLERLKQMNALIDLGTPGQEDGRRPIEACVVQPSEDPAVIARRHINSLPRSLRTLLRTMGALEARGGLLVSYLLFEKSYTTELMALGYEDAKRDRDEIEKYLQPWFRSRAGFPVRAAQRIRREG